MNNDVKVSPAVALVVGIVLAAWAAIQYIPSLHIGLAVHIVTGCVISVLGIYGLTAATPAVIRAAVSPRVLAAIAAVVASLAAGLPLIDVASVWHAVIAAVLAVAAVLMPGVTVPAGLGGVAPGPPPVR